MNKNYLLCPGAMNVADVLIKYGAKLHALDISGRTPLKLAEISGNMKK